MATSLFWLSFAALYRGDLAQARRLLEEALALFKEVVNKEYMAWSYVNLGRILQLQGEYTIAAALSEKAEALHKEIGDTSALLGKPVNKAHRLFLTGGDPATIRALAEEGLALAREFGYPALIANSLIGLAEASLAEGDSARARTLLEEAMSIVREQDEREGKTWMLFLLGKVALMQGDYAAAHAVYKDALALGYRLYLPFCLEGVADVATIRGEPRWAAQLWGAAEALREVIGTPIPPIWHADYERSVAAARAHLGEQAFVAAWAEGRTMTPEQALAAKEQVTIPTPTSAEPSPTLLAKRRAHYPAGLTARELEVLRLIARGLTDAEVAEQLVISPRTVNTHLTAIYGKIQVTSRSAATRYAIEQHLV